MSLYERLEAFRLRREANAGGSPGEVATAAREPGGAPVERGRRPWPSGEPSRREEPAGGGWRALGHDVACVWHGDELVDVRLTWREPLPPLARSMAHGGRGPDLGRLLPAARPPGLAELPGSMVWFDLETTGLGGGAGVRAFLVGVVRLAGDAVVIRQHVLPDLDREPGFLQEVAADLDEPVWVTYNGRAFDVPLLRDRFTLHGIGVPEPKADLDLLPAARAVWRRRLGRVPLSALGRDVLGLDAAGDPGGAVMPALYAAYLNEDDPLWLADALRHNRNDLLALVGVTLELAQALADPPARWPVADLMGLARLAERWGRVDVACAALDRALVRAEGPGERAAVLGALARLHKRERRYRQAVELLERAVAEPALPHLSHLKELAKLHEHRLRDAERALAVTDRALRLLAVHGGSARSVGDWERRRARLLRRLHRGWPRDGQELRT